MSVRRCPFDPSGMYDFPDPTMMCPACGCDVYVGLPHPPCIEPQCSFYDPHVASKVRHPTSRGAIFAPGLRLSAKYGTVN